MLSNLRSVLLTLSWTKLFHTSSLMVSFLILVSIWAVQRKVSLLKVLVSLDVKHLLCAVQLSLTLVCRPEDWNSNKFQPSNRVIWESQNESILIDYHVKIFKSTLEINMDSFPLHKGTGVISFRWGWQMQVKHLPVCWVSDLNNSTVSWWSKHKSPRRISKKFNQWILFSAARIIFCKCSLIA